MKRTVRNPNLLGAATLDADPHLRLSKYDQPTNKAHQEKALANHGCSCQYNHRFCMETAIPQKQTWEIANKVHHFEKGNTDSDYLQKAQGQVTRISSYLV